jgi:putative flippase GtrA
MEKVRDFIYRFLDIFYPLFKPFFNKQTYHYLACGGGNTLLGLVLYYYSYHNLFHKQMIDLGVFKIQAHIASLFTTSIITFPLGFILTKYIVWSDSTLPGKKQLFRHINFFIFASFLNYALLKLFVDLLDWWAMPSQILTTIIIVIFSYLTQKYISFKKVR